MKPKTRARFNSPLPLTAQRKSRPHKGGGSRSTLSEAMGLVGLVAATRGCGPRNAYRTVGMSG